MTDINGVIRVADFRIQFACDTGKNIAVYTVENDEGDSCTKRCDPSAFLKALSIMIHNDGMPDYKADYPDAESVQPDNPDLRFIP